MKLKPCPFCNHAADYPDVGYDTCCCQNPKCKIFALLFTVKEWNTRTPDPLAEKVIEAAIKCQASRKKDFSGIVHPADQELYDAVIEYQKVTP